MKVCFEGWSVPAAGWADILQKEPPGLSIGKVALDNGTAGLGIMGGPELVARQKDLSKFGGWRAYVAAEGIGS